MEAEAGGNREAIGEAEADAIKNDEEALKEELGRAVREEEQLQRGAAAAAAVAQAAWLAALARPLPYDPWE